MTSNKHKSNTLSSLSKSLFHILQSLSLDALIIAAAYLATLSVRSPAELFSPLNLTYIGGATALTLAFLLFFGVYRRMWSRSSGHEAIVVVIPMLLATVIIGLVEVLLLHERPLPLSVVLVGNALALACLVAVRYRSRLIVGMGWRWRAVWLGKFPLEEAVTRVLIVGAGQSGQIVALQFKIGPPPGTQPYQIVGFVDDDPAKQGKILEGYRVLGPCSAIPELAEIYNIDLIAIAIHNISGTGFRNLLQMCERTKAQIKVVPDLTGSMNLSKKAPLLRDITPEDLIGRADLSHHQAIDLGHVRGKVTLVTGAAGSIGSELCRQLCLLPVSKLIMLDNNESALHELHIELQTKFPSLNLIPVLADITVRELVEATFDDYRPQVVFHAAAYKHVPMLERHPSEAVRVNIGGTRNVAEAARNYQVNRFVLISTDKAVNPSGVMGASKRICELMLRAMAQEGIGPTLFTSVRFGNVLGSRGSVVPTFNHQIDNGGPVTVTDPNMTRYFMSIPEAVNLVIHAACLTKGNEIFLLRMGEEVRIVELAERMIRLRGLRPNVDIEIRYTGMRPGEKLHEELHNASERLCDTVHPNIVQLQDVNGHFDGPAFLANLDRLQLWDSKGPAELVQLMRKLAQPDESPVQVPQL